ncbi:MAG: hypothetical protein ACI4E1_03690 [Lachnospira sp.]
MANSNYYYNLYKQYKNTVLSLQKYINYLTKIRDGISSDFYDEQRNVNQELNDLKEDLKKATRHDSSWDTITSQCESFKEKASTADGNLDSAIDYLDAEIRSLCSQKSTAESNRDQAYRNYQCKKDEEYKAWLESLKQMY